MNAVARAGSLGWPDSPALTAARLSWFDEPDLPPQQAICRDVQMQFLRDLPYVPTGQFFQPMAYRNSLQGMAKGAISIFHNVTKT